jgi:hypothetical protein
MKLVALVDLRVPEGAFAAREVFKTTEDIAARVIAGGYARPFIIEAGDPEVTHRDPVAAVSPPPSSRRRRP